MGSRPWKQDFEAWMRKNMPKGEVLTVWHGTRSVDGTFVTISQFGRAGRDDWWTFEIEDANGDRHEFKLDRKLHINGEPVVTWWDKRAHPWMRRPGGMH